MSYPLYRFLFSILSLIGRRIFAARIKQGKEDPVRINERWAKALSSRPIGQVIWLHGASVGEITLLRGLVEAWDLDDKSGTHFLFTSQTMTSANLFTQNPRPRQIHQYAPLDTMAATRRFIAHWRPDLGIFAEGEIWPNLLDAAHKGGVPLALVNARMTHKSRDGWRRRGKFGRAVFGKFGLVLAADNDTAQSLSQILGREIYMAGNVKSALPPAYPDPATLEELTAAFKSARTCLLAASTHIGEEEVFLAAMEAVKSHKDYCAIIAVRHPERGDSVRRIIEDQGLSVAQRSMGEKPGENTDILLADTMGEMPLWYSLCDKVFLGGGTAENIGGHNPIEVLHAYKPIATGPFTHNFAEMFDALTSLGFVQCVMTSDDLAVFFTDTQMPDTDKIDTWLDKQSAPLVQTLEALDGLLAASEGLD